VTKFETDRPRKSPADSRPRPVLAMKAQSCADALDISRSTFDALVEEGKMPKQIAIPGHSGLALWDFKAVSGAWEALVEAAQGDAGASVWDSVAV
jgi:predicted DNA-binding transcriptional regulator AlpA